MNRTVNHLNPLEITSVADEFNMTCNEPRPDDNGLLAEPKLVRKTAAEARRKLKDQLQLKSIYKHDLFFSGRSVMEIEQHHE